MCGVDKAFGIDLVFWMSAVIKLAQALDLASDTLVLSMASMVIFPKHISVEFLVARVSRLLPEILGR